MKKFGKKALSMLLVALMVVLIFPIGAIEVVAANTNADIIYKFCVENLGLNTAGASGVVANIQRESGFRPTASCIDTNGKTSYGICQWNAGRYDNLKNWCNSNGYNYSTLEGQLNFLKYELQNSEKRAFSKIKSVANSADGAYTAGYYWAQYFERCASKYYTVSAVVARDTYWPVYSKNTPVNNLNEYEVQILDPGRYVYPVLGNNYVSSKYGYRNGSMHYGIDIATYRQNNTVVSTMAGTVTRVVNDCSHVSIYPTKCAHYNTYGNMVVIKNDNGNYVYYGHLQKDSITVKAGDRVYAGQKIACVGSSGYSTGEHLHFEIRKTSGSRSQTNNINVNVANMNYIYISEAITPQKKVSVPATPSITNISSNNIAKGRNITITWNAASGATEYIVTVTGPEQFEISTGTTTQASFTLNKAGTYNFKVKGINSAGSGGYSSAVSCTAHEKKKVNFLDYDGKLITTLEVDYGDNVQAPPSPSRKGYSFKGWDNSYFNVTSDRTLTALYNINTYTVNFLDRQGELISSEKVVFGGNATPPKNTNADTGYTFVDWNCTDYLNVYTEDSNKVINVYGIYKWENEDLPIICLNASAKRQDDGYYVNFDLLNYDVQKTSGRAVIALKTASDKLVYMTESAAFSIPKEGTKTNMEVFVPCDSAATRAEIIIVNNYSSGVPISAKVETSIDQALMWSNWSSIEPEDNGDVEIQHRYLYTYRDKEFSTGTSKTKDGWNWDGTRTESAGGWSGYSDSYVASFDNEQTRREVRTQNVPTYTSYPKYNYYRYSSQYSGGYSSPTWTSGKPTAYYYTFDNELSWGGTSSDGTPWYKWYYSGSSYCAVYRCGTGANTGGTFITYNTVQTGSKTQYSYRDINYTYNFWRWGEWSKPTTTEIIATDRREVKKTDEYRTKSISAAIENDDGVVRTTEGTLSKTFANKQLSLFVYRVDGASDFTNEYVGQTKINSDGSYKFTYKLREEPTVKTGDYTVAIGIEGTSNIIIIDTIKAPVPKYTVKFYDWDGSIISTQTVEEGKNATLPQNPELEGYEFVGWDKSIINIKEDTELYAQFEKKKFNIVFVDWENRFIEVQEYEYGQIIVPPQVQEIKGHEFVGWDFIESGNIIATKDMIITAEYDKKLYKVNFYDFDNNLISSQEIDYGASALAPETIEPSDDGKEFAGWFDPEQYENVEHEINVFPSYRFAETTEAPKANLDTGEYTEEVELTLTTSGENDVIYYYVDGDKDSEKIYTGPIVINKTQTITYYATCIGKNDSDEETRYYCINNATTYSKWLLYSELPEAVRANTEDYNIVSDKGYRYKDEKETSSQALRDSLVSSGWVVGSSKYSDYTAWQDEKIINDGSKLGFEIDTQTITDTSVKQYKYTRYKYTDGNGNVCYSATEVAGYDCVLETVTKNKSQSVVGFNPTTYSIDGENWFNQNIVNGTKTQYRSRYLTAVLYRWSEWTTSAPSLTETRDYETDTVYKYSNKIYHIVTIYDVVDGEVCEYKPVHYIVKEGELLTQIGTTEATGYTFNGYYYDEACESVVSNTQKVLKSLTIYGKYTPKTYLVTFKLHEGTEIETQNVEYLSAATEPSTSAVEGYVFAGWDKPFDCITEDTVITGTYFLESEYTTVSLNKSETSMYTGTSISLTFTLDKPTSEDTGVVWTTSDSSIVNVDENGVLTAISKGKATITATVPRTMAKATCNVVVNEDVSTSITISGESKLNRDSLGYIRRIPFNTPVQNVVSEFDNSSLLFYNISGTELGLTSVVGTGTTIVLKNGENVLDKETVVITGDMTGDGLLNNRDVAMVNRYLVNKVTPQECQVVALDLNGDGYINNKDAAMAARYLVGKDAII